MEDVHLPSAHNVSHRVYCHVMSLFLPVSGLADPNTTCFQRGCLKYKIEHGPDFAQGLVRRVCCLLHDDEIDSAVRAVSRGVVGHLERRECDVACGVPAVLRYRGLGIIFAEGKPIP